MSGDSEHLSESEQHVLELLLNDLRNTVGAGHEEAAIRDAESARLHTADLDEFQQRLVEDVQQYLHDTFVDTTWPACPEHPNHPLWFSESWWRCEQSGRRVARLGELAAGAH